MTPTPHTTTDIICEILVDIYVQDPKRFKAEALSRGITVEQLAAAEIAAMLVHPEHKRSALPTMMD